MGLDEVQLGMLYTNESYDPDGNWREEDEAFIQNVMVLQCVAVCCSVLQCVAVCCSVLQ